MEQDNKELKQIPYIIHEDNEARHERIVHRLIAIILIELVLIFLSHAMWLWAWVQYDYTSEEIVYTQDGRGLNIIGDRNGVDYGTEQNNTEENSD